MTEFYLPVAIRMKVCGKYTIIGLQNYLILFIFNIPVFLFLFFTSFVDIPKDFRKLGECTDFNGFSGRLAME